MSPSEELLEQAAKDGSFDAFEWPTVLETVLQRIDYVVHNDFTIPTIPITTAHRGPPSSPPKQNPEDILSSPSASRASNSSTQAAPPSSPPSVPEEAAPSTISDTASNTVALPAGTLLPPLHSIFTHVKSSLSTNFAAHPPHTIQRLAELVLYPRKHYTRLQTYLNALDRVVSVSSSTAKYPTQANDVLAGPLVNGTAHLVPIVNSDGDDSLGGALLTPIPWLTNGSRRSSLASAHEHATTNGVVGSNGHNDPEDVQMTMEERLRENGGLTQGELLRQEQEASDPPAPVGSAANREHVIAAVVAPSASVGDANSKVNGETTKEDSEGQPQARGPTGISAEDIGSQEHDVGPGQVLDMEAAVGRTPQDAVDQHMEGTEEHVERIGKTHAPSAAARSEEEEKKQNDDVVMADVEDSNDEVNRARTDGSNSQKESVEATA